jgi:hypothetical protein
MASYPCPHCYDPRVSFRHPHLLDMHLVSVHPEKTASRPRAVLPPIPAELLAAELLDRAKSPDQTGHVEAAALAVFIQLTLERIVRSGQAQLNDNVAIERLVRQVFDPVLHTRVPMLLAEMTRKP